MSGFFSAFGTTANEVSEDPFHVDGNTYNVAVTGSDLKTFKEIPYFVIQLTIADGKNAGKSASTMHRMKPWTQQERAQQGDFEAMNARVLSNFKVDMIAFGLSEEGLNQFDPNNAAHRSSLLGIKGQAYIESKNGYTNYKDFQRAVPATPVQQSAGIATQESPAAPVPDADAINDLMSGF